MKPAYRTDGDAAIVYDADRLDQAPAELFEPAYWEAQKAVTGRAAGRGTTFFVRHGNEEWALRHYRRGGSAAKFVEDWYLWSGLSRTRAWREWHLTAELSQRGLPVPAPVAARVLRHGFGYSADLITRRIAPATSLEPRLQLEPLDAAGWRQLGVMVRRFHDAGLCHADLNVRNILVTPQNEFHLIDFDKARLRPPGAWRKANLARLLRSFRKSKVDCAVFHYQPENWALLLEGYQAGPG